MSSFGRLFRITTFGESHCKSVGVIIDGCPPSMSLTEEDIQPQLTRRRPGQSKITTPRKEADEVTILSGTERGRTLGTPIALVVNNMNVKPGDYKEMSMVPRPGHADFTYQMKYGIRASSGGGRASARETIGRVAAGAVAEKYLLESFGTTVVSFVTSVGDVKLPAESLRHPSGRNWTREDVDTIGTLRLLRHPGSGWKLISGKEAAKEQAALDALDEKKFVSTEDPQNEIPAYVDFEQRIYSRNGVLIDNATIDSVAESLSEDIIHTRCPCISTACKIVTLVRKVKSEDDSIGGSAICMASNVPIGLGEPVFDKLEAKLAHAMMSLPATKGFEIGHGFASGSLRGSQHNDPFIKYASVSSNGDKNPNRRRQLQTKTNHAGGTLGGISSGEDIIFRVAVKPVSTIGQAQQTADFSGKANTLEAKGRHDPCVLPRVPPLIESMTALVLADAALIQLARCGSTLPDKGTQFVNTIADQNTVGVNADPTQPTKRQKITL